MECPRRAREDSLGRCPCSLRNRLMIRDDLSNGIGLFFVSKPNRWTHHFLGSILQNKAARLSIVWTEPTPRHSD